MLNFKRSVKQALPAKLLGKVKVLSEEYDDVLEKFYTTTSTKGVLSFKGPVRVILGNSLDDDKQ